MRIKNLLLLLIVVAALAYAGLKGYVYFKVKRQVDALVLAASPVVNIQYGSIGSTLDGVIKIADIVVTPRGIDGSVRIDQLLIRTPGIEFILRGGDSMRKGLLPQRMGLALRGARFSLEGSLANMLEKMEAKQTSTQPAEGQVCRLSRAFVMAQYRELGIRELVFDIDFMLERGKHPTELQMSVRSALRGIQEGNFTMTLVGVNESIYSIAKSTPLLKYAEISYKPNPQFVNKLLQYCAGRQNTDVPTFIEQAFDSDDAFADTYGFVPGPGIRDAMKELYRKPGELRIVANPVSPLNLNTINLYESADLPELFGLTVTVNNTAVTDISFKIPKGFMTTKDSVASPTTVNPSDIVNLPDWATATGNRQSSSKTARKRPQQTNKRNVRIATVKELPKLIGQRVKILTVEGKRRSGYILKVDRRRVYLEKRTRGGTMSTQVPLVLVGKIEVLD